MAQLVKNLSAMWETWVGKIPWRRERLPTPVFWPGEFHGLYSPFSHKESDMTEQLSLYLPAPWNWACRGDDGVLLQGGLKSTQTFFPHRKGLRVASQPEDLSPHKPESTLPKQSPQRDQSEPACWPQMHEQTQQRAQESPSRVQSKLLVAE